ncbi:MAG: peptide-methionine (R)-S-oxide reductase, partial [Balneolales bacterium]
MKERFFLYTFMVMIIGVHAGCEQGKSYYAHSTFENHEASHRQNSAIDKVVKSDDEWKEILTSSEYRILRNGGTEFPIVNEYNKTTTKGIYHCAACDLPIFDSETKYDSGSGWPAFYAPLEGN